MTLLPPPVDIDPKDKAMIDALIEVTERELILLWLVRYEFLPNVLGLGLAVAGAVGLLLFLVFLSTKPFGRGYYAGPAWWWFP